MGIIDFDLECAGCGANLRTCDSRSDCPVCSRSVSDTLRMTLLDPVDLRVNGDLSCVACNYNLRTLAAQSVCPECGREVVLSLSADPLRHADRDWLRSVARGTWLLGTASSVYILLGTMTCLAVPLSLMGTSLAGLPQYVAYQVCTILWCVGLFRATTPDAARAELAGTGRLGTWVRRMIPLVLVCQLVSYLAMIVAAWMETGEFRFWPVGRTGWSGPIATWIRTGTHSAAVLANMATWLLFLAYLKGLAHRMGRSTALVTAVMILFAVQGSVQWLFYGPVYLILMDAIAGISGTQVYGLWRIGFLAVSLGSLAALTPAVVLLRRFTRTLKAAADGRSDARWGRVRNTISRA